MGDVPEFEALDIDLIVDAQPSTRTRGQIDHFLQEFMGIPWEEDEREKLLRQLAEEYHKRTEAFDQRVCSGKRNGVTIPANGRERAEISRNARQVRDELLMQGQGYRITLIELTKAIQRYGSR